MRRNITIAAMIVVSITVSQLTSQELDPDLIPGQPPARPDRGSIYGGNPPALAPSPGGPAAAPDRSPSNGLELQNCVVVPLSQPTIAASEAGRLILGPELGDEVTADDLVAKTDDTVAVFQQRVSFFGYKAEKVKLESDVQRRYAEKQVDVSEAAYQDAKEANDKIKDAISPNVLRQRLFEWQGAKLGVEKAGHDMEVTRAGAEVKLAEYEAADAMVKRHEVKSPVTGIVMEVLKHKGEWVTPGEPIATLVQLDRVRVKGLIPLSDAAAPGKLKGKPVTISVPVEFDGDGNGTKFETFESKIMHVSADTTDNFEVEIYAEVENTEDRVFWPGIPGVVMKLSRP